MPNRRCSSNTTSSCLQHPFYWYSAPAIIKEWLDIVLESGWAYGDGGTKLHGKYLANALSTGGRENFYHPNGRNRFTIEELLAPFNQTAHLCGMAYLRPSSSSPPESTPARNSMGTRSTTATG